MMSTRFVLVITVWSYQCLPDFLMSVNSVTWQNYESIRLVSLVKIAVSPGCTNIK